MKTIKKLFQLLVSIILAGHMSVLWAETNPMEKYRSWNKTINLQQWASIASYVDFSDDKLANLDPLFIGSTFFLGNYNKDTYRTVLDVNTKFETNTFVTTNTLFSSTSYFTTEELFSSIVTGSSSMGASEWVANRAAYLETSFGFDPASAYATALSERSVCEGAGADCGDYGLFTDYELDFVGDEYTTVETDVTVDNVNGTPTSTTSQSGNSVVKETVTVDREITTTTTTTTEVIEDASVDRYTTATGADSDSVDIESREDTIGTIDRDTTEDTEVRDETRETTDKETTTSTPRQERNKKQWKLDISPIVFFDFRAPKSIISLNPHFSSVQKCAFDEAGIQATEKTSVKNTACDLPLSINNTTGDQRFPTLRVGQQTGAYKVISQHAMTIGLGAALNLHQINSDGIMRGFNAFLGLVPLKGSSVISERSVSNLQDAKKVGSLAIPYSRKTLESWKPFDKITYASRGGVMFIAGINVYGLTVGRSYMTLGEWNVVIQKIDDSRVYAKLTHSKIKSISTTVGASIISLNKTNFKQMDESLSFMYDLNDPKASKAFFALLLGKADSSQLLARDKDEKNVIAIETGTSTTQGKMRGVNIGIPLILGWNSSESNIHTFSQNLFHPDATQQDSHFGAYVHQDGYRFLRNEGSLTYGFYGAAYTTLEADKKEADGMFGQIGWSYKNTNTGRYTFQKVIADLIRKTGLKSELKVEIPATTQNGKANDDLDAVQLQFALRINHLATEILLSDNIEKYIQQIPAKFIKSYFQAVAGDRDLNRLTSISDMEMALQEESQFNDICESYYDPNASRSGAGLDALNHRRISECMTDVTHETDRAVKKMLAALKKMKKSHQAGDKKSFVKSYAKFGEAMLTNQFMFQTVFNLLKGRGVSAKYAISGTRIANYSVGLEWSPAISQE